MVTFSDISPEKGRLFGVQVDPNPNFWKLYMLIEPFKGTLIVPL